MSIKYTYTMYIKKDNYSFKDAYQKLEVCKGLEKKWN